MANRILIQAGDVKLAAELNDSETARAVWEKLPIQGAVNTWGEEIYFSIPVSADPSDTTTDLNVGTIAFWPPGNAFCIFFGITPASTSDKPAPASAVAILGKVIDDTEPLKAVRDGEKVVLSIFEE